MLEQRGKQAGQMKKVGVLLEQINVLLAKAEQSTKTQNPAKTLQEESK